MKRFIWICLIVIVIASLTGCARTKRIANDIDWIVFDGEPSNSN